MDHLGEESLESERSFSFADIAGWYDRLNRLMSFGRDQHWRDLATAELQLGEGSLVLDVGTGTGRMALAIRKRYPSAEVVALDATSEMMRRIYSKHEGSSIHWMQGDGQHLPFPDGSFDAIVSVFLLRNVQDVLTTLDEQRRVVRWPSSGSNGRGGRVVSLELVWPRSRAFGVLFQLYFGKIIPQVAGFLSGNRDAYSYLPRSVKEFGSPETLAAKMEQVGLINVQHRTLAGGTVALHVGERGV